MTKTIVRNLPKADIIINALQRISDHKVSHCRTVLTNQKTASKRTQKSGPTDEDLCLRKVWNLIQTTSALTFSSYTIQSTHRFIEKPKTDRGLLLIEYFSFSMYQWKFNTYKYKRLLFGVVLKTAIGPKATFCRQVSSPLINFHRGIYLSDKSTRPGVSKSTCKVKHKIKLLPNLRLQRNLFLTELKSY